MYDFPKPVSYDTLERLSQEVLTRCRMAGYRERELQAIDVAVDMFIADLRSEMSESGTVFYQP